MAALRFLAIPPLGESRSLLFLRRYALVFFFFFELRSICADVWPFMTQCRIGKVFMPRAVVHSTLRLAFSILPNGLVNVDFSSTTWRNWFDLLSGFFIWLADLLCGTYVLWVTIGSIRRTCSIWSFTVARRCKRWTSWECSLFSSTFALAPRRHSLHPPEVQRHRLDRNTCAHVPDGGVRCVTWNTRGLIGSPTSSQLSREQKHISFTRLAENNYLPSRSHGKDEFFQAIQILVPQFPLFGKKQEGGGNTVSFLQKKRQQKRKQFRTKVFF